jgi:hypothetical protein
LNKEGERWWNAISFLKIMDVAKNTIFAVYSEKFCKFPISPKIGIRTPYNMGM